MGTEPPKEGSGNIPERFPEGGRLRSEIFHMFVISSTSSPSAETLKTHFMFVFQSELIFSVELDFCYNNNSSFRRNIKLGEKNAET